LHDLLRVVDSVVAAEEDARADADGEGYDKAIADAGVARNFLVDPGLVAAFACALDDVVAKCTLLDDGAAGSKWNLSTLKARQASAARMKVW
jgi:hypothetical protein